MHQNTVRLTAGPRPDLLGSLNAPPDRCNRNREGPTSEGRNISIDWLQNGTTSLKYKAQRECRVPNSSHSHILLKKNRHRKFFVI